MGKRPWILAFLLILALAIAIPASVTALAGPTPQEFAAYGYAFIVDPGAMQPAGNSGRFVTTMEVVQTSPLQSGWEIVNDGALTVYHNSNAKLNLAWVGDQPILLEVENGRAHGKFVLQAADGQTYDGSYNSEISTTEGCTISDVGRWSLNSGQAQAHGTLDVCLNFNRGLGTFAGPVTMTGTRN